MRYFVSELLAADRGLSNCVVSMSVPQRSPYGTRYVLVLVRFVQANYDARHLIHWVW